MHGSHRVTHPDQRDRGMCPVRRSQDFLPDIDKKLGSRQFQYIN
jgi:hypothetical protein